MIQRKLIGHVGVDSGQLMIVDPCYIDSDIHKREGLVFHPGFGDGEYEVWATTIKSMEETGGQEVVAKVEIIMLRLSSDD